MNPHPAQDALAEFDRFCRFIDCFHDGGYVENDFMSKPIQAKIRTALQSASREWMPLTECPMEQTKGVFLTGEKLDLPDPDFRLSNGWPVYIRHDMRAGAVPAFHSLGATHFMMKPTPPKQGA